MIAAIDEINGSAGLMRYRDRARKVAADTLDHPFIAEMVDRRYSAEDVTSAALLKELTSSESAWKRPREWPKNARAVTAQLTRHAPALRAQGWTLDNDSGANHRNAVQWTIRPPTPEERGGNPDSHNSQHSHQADKSRSAGIGGCESDRESTASQTSGITRDDSQHSQHSQTEIPLTSADAGASRASHENGSSLVCRYCGTQLRLQSAMTRGFCSSAPCLAEARQRTGFDS